MFPGDLEKVREIARIERARFVFRVWNAIEGVEPTISTDRLLVLTAELCGLADVSEVTENLRCATMHEA